MDFSSYWPILVILGIALIVVALVATFRALWVVAEPNEALIISGLHAGSGTGLGFKIITGGGATVLPGLQVVRRLFLGLREVELSLECPTQQGVLVQMYGVLIFKVGDDTASIANAARRFLGQDDATITRNMQALYVGHARSIVGGMTVESLIRDRDALASEVRKGAGDETQKLGLIIDSLQFKKIVDSVDYIKSLAAPHIAAVQKEARIATASADQDATQREQEASAEKASYIRDNQIKQAVYKAEIDKAMAESKQAGPLAEATAKQNVTMAETRTAELNAQLAEQTLQATVRKPADAEAYATQIKAKAERDAAISRAEAEAKRIELDATAKANATKITGEAQASVTKVTGEAQASITKVTGEAQASVTIATGTAEGTAIKAKLMAEAEGLKARAEALAANQEAVIGQMLAEKMPEIVREAASAYAGIDNLIVLDGAQGISRGLGEIAGVVTTMFPLIRSALASVKKAGETKV